MRLSRVICFNLLFIFVTPYLFAASITNEGDRPVKVNGKSASGIMMSLTLLPEKTLPIRQKVLWIEHVPEGPPQEIRIKIITDDGNPGYISSWGGRYVFSSVPANTGTGQKPAVKLRPGYATNYSNVQMYITATNRMGGKKTNVVMPNQSINIPENTVEVTTEPFNTSFGDQLIQVEIIMPDAKRHTIRSTRATVRISPEAV
ncbi:MAG TPA: hypothetical protein PLO78_07410 [Candidatus Omnitrophota bacterium]|nr:hypothetical protein [Candidatus Omnitrophota bacterium]